MRGQGGALHVLAYGTGSDGSIEGREFAGELFDSPCNPPPRLRSFAPSVVSARMFYLIRGWRATIQDPQSGRYKVNRSISVTLLAVALGAPPAFAGGNGYSCPLFGGSRGRGLDNASVLRGPRPWAYPPPWQAGPAWPPYGYPGPMMAPRGWSGAVSPPDQERAADRAAARVPGVAWTGSGSEKPASGDAAGAQPEVVSGYRFRPLGK